MNSPIMRSRLTLPRTRAMTLIEILVVMSIMIILVSAVVVAVFHISAKGPVMGTKGLLEQIAQGLEQYKSVYRMYPPADPYDPVSLPYPASPNSYLDVPPRSAALNIPTQPAEVAVSSGVLWQALEYYNNCINIGGTCKAQGGIFTDTRSGSIQPWYYYVDAWQQPLCYVCPGPSYTQYTLTSAGPDTILGTPDDIVKP